MRRHLVPVIAALTMVLTVVSAQVIVRQNVFALVLVPTDFVHQ